MQMKEHPPSNNFWKYPNNWTSIQKQEAETVKQKRAEKLGLWTLINTFAQMKGKNFTFLHISTLTLIIYSDTLKMQHFTPIIFFK